MLACDKCEDWFHGKCVDVSKKQAKNLSTYYCPACMAQFGAPPNMARELSMPVSEDSSSEADASDAELASDDDDDDDDDHDTRRSSGGSGGSAAARKGGANQNNSAEAQRDRLQRIALARAEQAKRKRELSASGNGAGDTGANKIKRPKNEAPSAKVHRLRVVTLICIYIYLSSTLRGARALV